MKLAAILASVLMVGSLSMAADSEHTESTKVDNSHNAITGTDKTVKTTKRKVKGSHGEATEKVTETTKVGRDGKVETETEVKAKAEDK